MRKWSGVFVAFYKNSLAGGYWKIDKTIAKHLGCTQSALVLDELIFHEIKHADHEGWFFYNSDDLEKNCLIGKRLRQRIFDDLTKFGFLEIKKVGLPARFYYKINHNAIDALFVSAPTSELHLAPTGAIQTAPTIIYKEKDINKKIDIEDSGSTNSELFEIWNQTVKKLGKALKETKQRKDKAKALWKQNPDKDYWISVIKRMENSLFCTGTNSNGWKADYDFFLKPDTFLKVLEGKYDNAKNAQNKNNLTTNKTSFDREYDPDELDKLLGIK